MRIVLGTFILISTLLFAKADKLSTLKLPQNIFIDLDITTCDDECLLSALERNEIFTFLSKYKSSDSLFINSEYNLYKNLLNVNNIDISMIKVALLVPSRVVGKYSTTTTKSIISYMIHKKRDFNFRVFNSFIESKEALLDTFKEIKKADYRYVIALLTENGLSNLDKDSVDGLFIYIPSLNSEISNKELNNITYGGLDYTIQLQELKKLSNGKVVNFYDSSPIGYKLLNYTRGAFDNIYQEKEIDNNPKFKSLIRWNKKAINHSSIILNTPIVKSSLILSQLNYHDANVDKILSTQLNYNPMIMNLTQRVDRKKFFVANSILNVPNLLSEKNLILDNSINYDWVNYSTSIGIDYIYSLITGDEREFAEDIESSQVQYKTKLYQIGDSKIFSIN
jgi:SRSO17 transposase